MRLLRANHHCSCWLRSSKFLQKPFPPPPPPISTSTSHDPSTHPDDAQDLLASIDLASSGTTGTGRNADTLHRLSALLLHESPHAAKQVWDERGAVSKLLRLQECGVKEVEEQARICLSLLGHAPPYSGRGLRILSIDGGGTRLVGGSLNFPPNKALNSLGV